MTSSDLINQIVKDCAACNGTGEGDDHGKDWSGPTEKPCEPCGGTGKNQHHKRLVDELVSELTKPTAAPGCTCREIQAGDSLRHFRECPLRKPLPPGHPQADPPHTVTAGVGGGRNMSGGGGSSVSAGKAYDGAPPSDARQLTSGGVGLVATTWKQVFDLGHESGYRDGLSKATDEIRALRQKVDEQVDALRRAGMTDAERELIAATFETYRFGDESRSFYESMGGLANTGREGVPPGVAKRHAEITAKGMAVGHRWKEAVEAVIKERAPDHESRTTERIRRLNELTEMVKLARSEHLEEDGEILDDIARRAMRYMDALTDERTAAVFPLPSGDIEF